MESLTSGTVEDLLALGKKPANKPNMSSPDNASAQVITELPGKMDLPTSTWLLMVEQINLSTRDQHRATTEIANAIEIIRSLGMGVRCSTDEQRQGSRLITNAMLSMSEMVAQIAEARKAQAGSSEAIEHSLHVFHDISEESTRRADSMNTMVSTLSQRSQKLEREMDRFKTE